MNMRKVKIESVADFDALPEDEWVEVPKGVKVDLVFDDMRVEDGKILIRLPPSIVKQFKASRGRRLKARITGRQLVVEK
jgi:hypothetical protein